MGYTPELSFIFGGNDRNKPSLGKIDLEKSASDMQYRGSWLRGNQLPPNHPGYCNELWDPIVKFWVAKQGSEYARDHGHERVIPAHGGARNEYVYVLHGELLWINTSVQVDHLTFGTGPVKLHPWQQGAWKLDKYKSLSSAHGVTLALAEPPETTTARVGHGASHEIHLLGLPDQDPIVRLAKPDHLQQDRSDMLLMVFGGSIELEKDKEQGEGRHFLDEGSFLYYPAAERCPTRPLFTHASPTFRAALLFYVQAP